MAVDGFYTLNEMISVEMKKFDSESEMKKFIINNINEFCNDVLGVRFKSLKSEFKISDGSRKRKSIDLLITDSNDNKIAVELKNPTHKSELQSAIGQCLVYMTSLKMSGQKVDRFVLVSSVYDFLVPLTISGMKLPIEFVVMDNSKFSIMSRIDHG